jgi:hypothetical protein
MVWRTTDVAFVHQTEVRSLVEVFRWEEVSLV